MTPKAQARKETRDNVYNSNKKLCIKGQRQQNEEVTTAWDNTVANCVSDKGLRSRICRELKLHNETTKNFKNRQQRTGIDISPKKTHEWPMSPRKDARCH